ncbi:MAG: N-acetylmuramoyl-L-alanine amidase [Roseburia sp.]|nr:N-acetylmuramoyl-L-alanine amidase [Roseburia sp.]MCM1096700.1 N-acetylmuramoyl-L-alanine amidase [Ruminococcus flavefaciens]
MYGQAGRKGYEVRLVRMNRWDDRVRGERKSGGRIVGRAAVVLAAMTAAFAACMWIIWFLSPIDAEKTTIVSEKEMLAAAPEAGPIQGPEPEAIVMEEPEPESKIPLVAIDPGHGGEDEGCSGDGVQEKDINLEVAQRLAVRLRDMGFDVILTREDGEKEISLKERVDLAEEKGADIFVSIHQNASEKAVSSAKGIETWYCGRDRDCRRLAQLIHKGALGKTKARERELQESRELYVIRETSMPACLIETGFLTNAEERKQLCDADYQEKLAEGIAEGIYYYFYPKTMYLTFDDGPSEENTSKVLDILKERGIKATFFVVGENVRMHPEVARRIVEEGHTIGIHCNRHDYEEIYESAESYLADFQEAYDTVLEITGVEVKFFRFPGGSINCYNEEVYEEIIAEMTERGFTYFDWNGSLEDAVSKSTPEKLVENAVKSTLGRKKVVMLAHDIVYNTTLCLEELIDSFPEYRMEPLTEEVKPIQF